MIKDYWIKPIRETQEFQALDNTMQEEQDCLKEEVKNLLDDQFLETATEEGIIRREKMLKIQPYADDTLESRRFRIGVRQDNQLPYTQRILIEKLDALVGPDNYTLNVSSRHIDIGRFSHQYLAQFSHLKMQVNTSYQTYTLIIKINLGVQRMMDEIYKVVRSMIPSNIVIQIEVLYNRYADFEAFTYQELQLRTFKQLKEEAV